MKTPSVWTSVSSWTASLLVVMATLTLGGAFEPSHPGRALLFVAAAIGCFAVAASTPVFAVSRRGGLGLVVMAAALASFDAGILAALAFGVAGTAALVVGATALPPLRKALRAVSSAAAFVGVVAVVFAGLAPLFDRLELFRAFDGWARTAILGAARVFGVSAVAVDGDLLLELDSTTVRFAPDWWKGGTQVALGLLVVDVVRAAFAPSEGRLLRRSAALSACLGGFLAARTLVLVVATVHAGHDMTGFVRPVMIFASFAPAAVLAAFLFPWPRSAMAEVAALPGFPGRKSRLILVPGGVLAAALVLGWPTPGSVAPGRVLLDEAHSSWESTTEPFDGEHWGRRSTYNYYCFADLMERHYDLVRHATGEIRPETLAGVQVVVLKMPTRPYTTTEIAAIERFVNDGGGLWLIGDHTNLFGMGEFLNQLAERFGISFAFDSTYDALTGGTTFYTRSWPLHPVAARAEGLAYQTSCSLRVHRPDFEPVFVGRRLSSEHADYNNPNFFGDMTTAMEDRIGTFLQAVAVRSGKGRVLAFTDSTIFSNFSLFDEGISETVLSSVEWLRRRGGIPLSWRWPVFLVLAALVVASGAGAARANPAATPILAAVAALVGFLAGSLTDTRSAANGLPTAHHPYRIADFVTGASRLERTSFLEDAMRMVGDRAPRAVGNLFTSFQRIPGWHARFCTDLGAALEKNSDLVVLFQPTTRPTGDERRALYRWIARGGRLFVIDDLGTSGVSTASAWLGDIGLGFEVVEAAAAIHDPAWRRDFGGIAALPALAPLASMLDVLGLRRPERANRLGETAVRSALVVDGGTPFLLDGEGRVIGASIRLGRGVVIAFSNAYALSDRIVGSRAEVAPGELERTRARLALEVLRKVTGIAVGKDPEERP